MGTRQSNEIARSSSSARTQSLSSSITRRDRDRWRRWRDGQTDEEIALADHTDVLKIRKSIQRVLSYQSSVSHEAVDMAANELAIDKLKRLGDVIDEVMQAEKEVSLGKDAAGTEVKQMVPDLKMRLSAFDRIVKLIQSVRKSDGATVNVNQNNHTERSDA